MNNELNNIEKFRSELERLANELAVEGGERPAFKEARHDTGGAAGPVYSTLEDLVSGRRRQVLHALQRLHEGSYGICESCGHPIDRERLEVIPETGFCVTCQQNREEGAELRFKAAQSDEEYV